MISPLMDPVRVKHAGYRADDQEFTARIPGTRPSPEAATPRIDATSDSLTTVTRCTGNTPRPCKAAGHGCCVTRGAAAATMTKLGKHD